MTLARALLVPLLAVFGQQAFAQVLIDPVVVELGARQKSAGITVTLSPKAAKSMTLQTEVLAWSQDVDGQQQLKSSSDLLVVPPIVELKPGESQLVRVAFRGKREGSAEQAYRLMVEDAGIGAGSGGISFRMRYDLPVMVGPTEAPRQDLQWSACAADADTVCVRLSNAGNRRVTFRKLEVAGSGWTLPIDQPGTVLAQSAREWRLPRPAGKAGAPASVSGETMRSEPIAAQLAAR